MPGRSVRFLVVVAAGMVVLLSAAAAVALGSFSGASVSGEITQAEANETWTSARIAGSAQWTECPEAPEEPGFEPFGGGGEVIIGSPGPRTCSWTPYATIAPGSDPAECDNPRRHLNQLGDNVILAWQGVIRTTADSQSFDVPEAPVDGTPGQLLCLSMWETVDEPAVCVGGSQAGAAHSQRETLAIEEGECPEYLPVSYYYTLDAMPLRVVQPPGNPSPPGGGASQPLVPGGVSGGSRSVAVPWTISSILGPRSLTLSWAAKYCVGAPSPQLERVAVHWLHPGHRRFRARITAYVSYPGDEGQGARAASCEEVARVSMSQRVRLRHPLLKSVLLDGGISPMKQRWPG